jgi:hypothetical protein
MSLKALFLAAKPEQKKGNCWIRKTRCIEEMLVREYEVARAELDRIKPGRRTSMQDALVECTEAMRRLRRFLESGEIPRDVADRILDFRGE